jgi:hypothetical protein
MTPEQEIRARALEIANQGRSLADPRQVMIRAELFAAYIRAGDSAIPAEAARRGDSAG